MLTRRTVIASGSAAIGMAAAPSAGRGEALAGVWTARADMPFPVQEIYPAAFRVTTPLGDSQKPQTSTLLVNAGGVTGLDASGLSVSSAVSVYDPATDQWTLGPALPAPRHHIALIANAGILFALAGFAADGDGEWRMQQDLWRIDGLDAARWTPCARLAAPQAESVAVSLEGRLHVAGGRTPRGSRNLEWDDHIDTDAHWAYDPRSDAWSPRAPLPVPRNSAAGAVVDGFFFVFGGRTVSGGNVADCHIYDPRSDRWQAVAPIPKSLREGAPKGQAGNAAAVWNGKVYMMGGEWFSNGGGVYPDAWEYDPRADKWRAVAPMARPRHGLGAVALADGIYVCGGASQSSARETTAFLDRFTI